MLARAAYGSLFVVAMPLMLAAWAWRLDQFVDMPCVAWPGVGAVLTAVGVGLMVWAMAALWTHGGGLPMNAFPPPRFVSRGPYRIISQPIYVGFVLACAGASVIAGSPSGFWIITPMAALGCAALVIGYESHDLRRRFGASRPRPWLTMPSDDVSRPGAREVASVMFLVCLPWLVLYYAAGFVPTPDAIDVRLPLERAWPVIEWTEAIYASVYMIVPMAVVIAKRKQDLRRFFQIGIVGTGIGILVYLTVPFISPPREFEPTMWLGRLLMFERIEGLDGRAAWPSFHVFWTCAAAWLLTTRAGGRGIGSKLWIGLCVAWAMAVMASCVTTGMHATFDVAAGLGLFIVAATAPMWWAGLVAFAESVANSWRVWRFGPVRIINHGIYAGLAASVGVGVAGMIAGDERLAGVVGLAVASIVGAGLWGQWLVGSKTLLRPFGYFGSVVGVSLVLVIAHAAGHDVWVYAGAVGVAAPWVVAIGRLRCLVQGCCHGAPTTNGIRYRHPCSRVCRIAGLVDVPVHPTPLYSIVGHIVIGGLMLRLWAVEAPAPMVAGAYLLLAGFVRFVEESYRGEPQTPIVGGLRLYQWLAIGLIAAGGMLTCVGWDGAWPSARVDGALAGVSVVVGLLHVFAMGVDFPSSNRRFSRLV